MKIITLLVLILSCYKSSNKLNIGYKSKNEYWKCIKRDDDLNLRNILKNELININTELSDEGDSSIILAVKCNSKKVVKTLIEKGTNINYKDRRGLTPLMYASIHLGSFDIMKLLLNHNANVNEVNIYGTSSFILAADTGNLEALKLLLENGADINSKDKDNVTALMYSVQSLNTEVLKFLLEKGADYEATDICLRTALLIAVEENYLEAVNFLIEKGADIGIADQEGETPLIAASKAGHAEIVKLILDKKSNSININTKDLNGFSALTYAAKNNKVEVVKLLLNEDIDVNCKDIEGKTPLIYAVSNQNIKISELILQKTTSDKEIKTPLNYLIYKYLKILKTKPNDEENTKNSNKIKLKFLKDILSKLLKKSNNPIFSKIENIKNNDKIVKIISKNIPFRVLKNKINEKKLSFPFLDKLKFKILMKIFELEEEELIEDKNKRILNFRMLLIKKLFFNFEDDIEKSTNEFINTLLYETRENKEV